MSAFVLRAGVGDAELGILAGDFVVAERAVSAEPGVQVVALVDDVASVRRFVPGMRVVGRVLEVYGRRG